MFARAQRLNFYDDFAELLFIICIDFERIVIMYMILKFILGTARTAALIAST